MAAEKQLSSNGKGQSVLHICKTTWDDLTQTSSVGALWGVYRARHRYRRWFWYLLVLAGFFVTIVTTVTLIETFLQFPFYNQVIIELQQSVSFPSVTICNYNRVNCKQLEKLVRKVATGSNVKKKEVISHIWLLSECPKLHIGPNNLPEDPLADLISARKPVLNRNIKKNVKQRRPLEEHGGFDGDPNDEYNLEMEFLSLLLFFSEDERKQLGHSFRGMFWKCFYNSMDCLHESFFYTFFNPIYGNCFIFNHAILKNKNDEFSGSRSMAMTGNKNTFEFIVNIDQSQYMPSSLSSTAGIRVIVESSLVQPNPKVEGIDVMPGSEVSIALTQVGYSTLISPYKTRCVYFWNETLYTPQVNGNYSTEHCIEYCIQTAIIDRCSCYHPLYQTSYEVDKINVADAKPCLMKSGQEDDKYECGLEIIEMYKNGSIQCNCPQPCWRTSYRMDVSQKAWPASNYMFHGNGAPGGLDPSDPDDVMKIRDNFLSVKIFFKTLQTEFMFETKTHEDFWSYLSSLGGTLSLLLGFTLVAVLEIIEFVILLIVRLLAHLCGIYQPVLPSSPTRLVNTPTIQCVSPALPKAPYAYK